MAAHNLPMNARPRIDLTARDAHCKGGQQAGLSRYEMGTVRAKTLYGVVRMAFDKVTGTEVVVKQCDKRLVAAKQTRNGDMIEENVEEEARLHQKLTSSTDSTPHVLKFLDRFETNRYIFLVLELADGGEMFSHVGDRPPLTDAARLAQQRHLGMHPNEIEAQRYAKQLFLGVAFLHFRRVCHRDLSLENLMLDARRRLKIIDFGLAMEFEPQNEHFRTAARAVGKVGYMAPEVYANLEYDARANDMWCCGIIVFIILVGAPPYRLPATNDPRFRLLASGGLQQLLQHWRVLQFFSKSALEFVQHLLLADVSRRATLPQVLRHPWLGISREELQSHGVDCDPELIYDSSVSVSDDSMELEMGHEATSDPFGHGVQVARTADDC